MTVHWRNTHIHHVQNVIINLKITSSCDFYIRDPWIWKSCEIKEKTDISRSIESESIQILYNLCYDLAVMMVMMVEMVTEWLTDMHNGWKKLQKHTQPCLNHITCLRMCAPLTCTQSVSIMWWCNCVWLYIEAVYTVCAQTGEDI